LRLADSIGTLPIWETRSLRSDVVSFMIHLVVPRATFLRAELSMPFTTARTAAIWVPPAMMTGTDSAAPATRPAAGAIMGSPTASMAAMGSFLNPSFPTPLAFRPSCTTWFFSEWGLAGRVLETFPMAS